MSIDFTNRVLGQMDNEKSKLAVNRLIEDAMKFRTSVALKGAGDALADLVTAIAAKQTALNDLHDYALQRKRALYVLAGLDATNGGDVGP